MTFNSVYEITNPLTTVAGQRFIDDFSGSSLDSKKWGFTEASGNGTRGMTDDGSGSGGGYSMTTSSSNGSNYMQLKGGNGTIRQFDAEGCAFIAVVRALTGSNNAFYVGMHEDSYFAGDHSSSRSYYRLSHRNNLIGTGNVDTATPIDYDWHTHHGSTDGVAVNYGLDGVQGCTATYPIPSTEAGDLEAWWQTYTPDSSTSRSCAIRYFEAWNH